MVLDIVNSGLMYIMVCFNNGPIRPAELRDRFRTVRTKG